MIFKREEQRLLDELISLGERLAEDRIYEEVMAEIENDKLDAVAKARAFEQAEGDSQKARALYIKHRVRRIRDLAAEYEIWLQQEKAKKAAEQKERIERRMLSERMKKGLMPPREIENLYDKEFLDFYSIWVTEDYARKFVPRASAWREFLLQKKLID